MIGIVVHENRKAVYTRMPCDGRSHFYIHTGSKLTLRNTSPVVKFRDFTFKISINLNATVFLFVCLFFPLLFQSVLLSFL